MWPAGRNCCPLFNSNHLENVGLGCICEPVTPSNLWPVTSHDWLYEYSTCWQVPGNKLTSQIPVYYNDLRGTTPGTATESAVVACVNLMADLSLKFVADMLTRASFQTQQNMLLLLLALRSHGFFPLFRVFALHCRSHECWHQGFNGGLYLYSHHSLLITRSNRINTQPSFHLNWGIFCK